MHHSCTPANPSLPCGAGISLEDCHLPKCSQANDVGSRGCEMWSLKTEFGGTVFPFLEGKCFQKAEVHIKKKKKGEDKQNPEMIDVPPQQIWYLTIFNFFNFCFLTIPFTIKEHECWCFTGVVCSVLMGAVCGLGAAKVNYCTGRSFWLHRIFASAHSGQ